MATRIEQARAREERQRLAQDLVRTQLDGLLTDWEGKPSDLLEAVLDYAVGTINVLQPERDVMLVRRFRSVCQRYGINFG